MKLLETGQAMKYEVTVLLVGLAVGSAMGVSAHHSVAKMYDENRTMTIEGEVTHFLDNSPHALVHLVVQGDRGRPRTWAVEFDDPDKLSSSGGTHEALRPGDRIAVCGNPGRDPGEYRLRMLALERPSDGLSMRSEIGLSRFQCADS